MVSEIIPLVSLLLFLIGVILCSVEIFTPGFGFFALSGIGCIVGSIYMIAPDLATAIKYLAIVLFVMMLCAPILLKFFSKSRSFERLLVKERLTTEDGYIAGKQEQAELIGRFGVALTILRPSGTVELDDGTRIDVITRGEFIEKGESVQVTHKDGTWLVVEKRRK